MPQRSDKESKPDRKKQEEIPPAGNLGLLAYGHKGVIAWRRARENARHQS